MNVYRHLISWFAKSAGAAWRRSDRLASILNRIHAGPSGTGSVEYPYSGDLTRVHAIRDVRKGLGLNRSNAVNDRAAQLVGELAWKPDPGKQVIESLQAGHAPDVLYRGHKFSEPYHGYYGTDVHTSPHTGVALNYARPLLNGQNFDQIGPVDVLQRYQARPDQVYHGDYGLESGSKGYTVPQMSKALRSATSFQARQGTYETAANPAGNPFLGFSLHGEQGNNVTARVPSKSPLHHLLMSANERIALPPNLLNVAPANRRNSPAVHPLEGLMGSS